MSLYPSLEDMAVAKHVEAQAYQETQQHQQAIASGSIAPDTPMSSSLYPSLNDFMGLQISQATLQQNMPSTSGQVVQYQAPSQQMVAPVTGNQNMGLMRSEVKQGIRQIIACKDQKGKMGIRVQHVNKGVFVSFVQKGSAAAMAGLRFGDQILQINGETLAGFDRDKVMKLIKKTTS